MSQRIRLDANLILRFLRTDDLVASLDRDLRRFTDLNLYDLEG